MSKFGPCTPLRQFWGDRPDLPASQEDSCQRKATKDEYQHWTQKHISIRYGWA